MTQRLSELRYKEIIDVSDGTRFGFVGDVEVDWSEGRIQALVIPGRLRLFGLLGREEDVEVPFGAVKRFGEDIILVDGSQAHPREKKRTR